MGAGAAVVEVAGVAATPAILGERREWTVEDGHAARDHQGANAFRVLCRKIERYGAAPRVADEVCAFDSEFVEQGNHLGGVEVPHWAGDGALVGPTVLQQINENRSSIRGEERCHRPEVGPRSAAGAASVQENRGVALAEVVVMECDAICFGVQALRLISHGYT